MSASLTNSANLANDNGFRNRVRAAIIETATVIIGEDNSPIARIRKNLAAKVINDPDAWVRFFLYVVADNAQISQNTDPVAVTDDQIRAVVQSVWSAVAVKDL